MVHAGPRMPRGAIPAAGRTLSRMAADGYKVRLMEERPLSAGTSGQLIARVVAKCL
jgi:hypothetical protein